MSTQILVIEDDGTFRELVRHLLNSEGYTVLTAVNGANGIALAINEMPDLVLCDIFLPDMMGLDVLGHLRKSSFPLGNPIIAITASNTVTAPNLASVHGRMADAGFNGYIPKPINPKTFIQQVEEFLPNEKRLQRAIPNRHE